MTTIYLACSGTAIDRIDLDKYPVSILVSYFYLGQHNFLCNPKRTMLDSGAYSAWNSGKVIDVDSLIEETKSNRWDECVSLDVIGDGLASLRNAIYMKDKGSPAYPVFHIGEDWSILKEYCGLVNMAGGGA